MTRSPSIGNFRNDLNAIVTNVTNRQSWLVCAAFVAVLAFAWFCYQPAISGPFQFDDDLNLRGLATIEDAPSAIKFIFSGIAGPTGRPLALASFALQAEQWEQGASAFLRINIVIHLINAILLALCLYRLSMQRMVNQRNSIIVATTSASLWVLMPLLATASLLVVQRMTTLSATFVMLALLGYLSARAIIHDRPKQALLGMSLSLAVGTVLATLTKESGALLPVFVLVIEATVLERPVNIKTRVWRTWQTVFLVLPLVLLLVYLATCINYPEHLLVRRDFNAWERVLTETRVLWIYLSKAIVGIPGQLGVYQYPPTVSRSLINPLTLLASLTWMSLLVISILWRRRYPLFAVAVLWYLAGHLIESTVVGLELYFEHRNYLPIIGPLFGLCSFLVLYLEPRRRRIAAVSVAVLAIVNAWFLYSFATLWGDSSLAARYWANRYPDSPRAVLRMATFRLAEDGPGPALQTIDSFVTANPEHAYMYISALNLLCQLDPENDYRKIIARLEQELPKIHYNNVTSWMLVELLQTAEKSNCNGVDGETVTLLAKILRSNPDYAVQPTYNKFYFKTLAYVAWQQGKYDETIHYLRQVIDYGRGSDVNVMMVMALGNLGRFDDAREFIDQVRNLAPLHPAKAAIWQQELDNLSEYVQQLEQKTRRPHSSQPG